MADESKIPKVGTRPQEISDAYYTKKLSEIRVFKGQKVMAMKNKNKWIGVLLASGACAIYGYTMFSVRQGKLLEDFDKIPE